MKKTASKTIPVILCGALIAASASCSAPTNVLTIDGVGIRPGIYIINQQTALDEATNKLREEQPNLDMSAEGFDFKSQIIEEGKTAEQWVNDKAIDYCREYVAISRLFEEKGLKLTADQLSAINSDLDSFWNNSNFYAQYIYGTDTLGEYYESVGVSQQSYKDIRTNSDKYNDLFRYIYGKGGEKEVSEGELKAEVLNTYAAALYFEAKDGKAQEYADSIKGGKSYSEVYGEYELAQKKADIEEAIKEAEENGEEYTGETADELTADIKTEDELMHIINKEATTPSEEFVKKVFEMNAGDVTVFTDGEGDDASQYVIKKLDLGSMSDKVADYSEEALKKLKGEEFSSYISSVGAGYTLVKDASISSYKIDKLLNK